MCHEKSLQVYYFVSNLSFNFIYMSFLKYSDVGKNVSDYFNDQVLLIIIKLIVIVPF